MCERSPKAVKSIFFFYITFETAEPENREQLLITVAKEHVCMQHIEKDQFAQWRVVVIVLPAQFASVFYLLCAVV